MSEVADFRALQQQFAQHLRDPRQPPPAGIGDRRLAIYRELFFNTVCNALDAAFPVLRTVLAAAVWRQLQRDFYAQHRSPYPQLHRAAEAFVEYLHEARVPQPDDPPFLADLAHYEWVELELSIAEDAPRSACAGLQLNPLARVLEYAYPVHRIGSALRVPEPATTWLAVWRDAADAVRFIELNALSARLLMRIEASPGASAEALLQQLADELPQLDRATVRDEGLRLLDDLQQRGLLCGASDADRDAAAR